MLQKQTEQTETQQMFSTSFHFQLRWNEVRLESIWYFIGLIKYAQFI